MVMLNEMVLPPVQKERETRPLFEEEVREASSSSWGIGLKRAI